MKDASALPRGKEYLNSRVYAVVKRIQSDGGLPSPREVALMKTLKAMASREGMTATNDINSGNRQHHYIRVQEDVILEYKIGDWSFRSTADLVGKVVARLVRDGSGKLVTRRSVSHRPAKRVSFNKKNPNEVEKEEETS